MPSNLGRSQRDEQSTLKCANIPHWSAGGTTNTTVTVLGETTMQVVNSKATILLQTGQTASDFLKVSNPQRQIPLLFSHLLYDSLPGV